MKQQVITVQQSGYTNSNKKISIPNNMMNDGNLISLNFNTCGEAIFENNIFSKPDNKNKDWNSCL